jgi:flagellar motor protein MotB
MASGGINSKRLSVRGFGEFRPEVENKPGPKGTSENRRVEIFIVPSGA